MSGRPGSVTYSVLLWALRSAAQLAVLSAVRPAAQWVVRWAAQWVVQLGVRKVVHFIQFFNYKK